MKSIVIALCAIGLAACAAQGPQADPMAEVKAMHAADHIDGVPDLIPTSPFSDTIMKLSINQPATIALANKMGISRHDAVLMLHPGLYRPAEPCDRSRACQEGMAELHAQERAAGFTDAQIRQIDANGAAIAAKRTPILLHQMQQDDVACTTVAGGNPDIYAGCLNGARAAMQARMP